ncbi:hypothetical protein E2C01_053519 [Portunus trituberculatus]|uniref:Uncharacterized protein n=1 Tax=Portunus trituberculatus TaxID=210409 RepID=A0A5B7GPE9_PORTR|nr:hypothetical protein [Portunus trituberculatus]
MDPDESFYAAGGGDGHVSPLRPLRWSALPCTPHPSPHSLPRQAPVTSQPGGGRRASKVAAILCAGTTRTPRGPPPRDRCCVGDLQVQTGALLVPAVGRGAWEREGVWVL